MNGPIATAHSHAGLVRSKVARTGLIGKGSLYTLLGLLSINVAMGNHANASEAGAVHTVASAPFGKFLLIALTVSLIALVVWKFSQAFTGDPIEGSESSDRAIYAVKGVVYSAAALTSLSILIANWGGSAPAAGDSKKQATGFVMGLPGGQFIVMLIGIVAIGFGGYEIYKHAINCEFMNRFGSLDQRTSHTVEVLGRAGYTGHGLVIIGVGFFFIVAGLTFDPNNAKGLSGLLAELAGKSWGQIVLWLIALGLFAYGLLAFVEARHRRAT